MKKIEIEICDGNVQITNNSRAPIYPGDRGVERWVTVELTRDELKAHIDRLNKVWRKMGESA